MRFAPKCRIAVKYSVAGAAGGLPFASMYTGLMPTHSMPIETAADRVL